MWAQVLAVVAGRRASTRYMAGAIEPCHVAERSHLYANLKSERRAFGVLCELVTWGHSSPPNIAFRLVFSGEGLFTSYATVYSSTSADIVASKSRSGLSMSVTRAALTAAS